MPYFFWNLRVCLNFPLCSSRIVSRGITLADLQSDEFYSNSGSERSQMESSTGIEISLPSESTASVSALLRLKEKLRGMWLRAVQRWPAVWISCFFLLEVFFSYIENYFFSFSGALSYKLDLILLILLFHCWCSPLDGYILVLLHTGAAYSSWILAMGSTC